MGTGTGDMIRRFSEAGLPEPDSVTDGFRTFIRMVKAGKKSSEEIADMIRHDPEITIPEMTITDTVWEMTDTGASGIVTRNRWSCSLLTHGYEYPGCRQEEEEKK